jgi:protein-tyrosine-phosphatase
MAEGLFRDLVKKNSSEFVIQSAGVGAQNDLSPSENSVRAMNAIEIDITGQLSQMVTVELVKEANMIIGMTQGHSDMINLMFPEVSEKNIHIERVRPIKTRF